MVLEYENLKAAYEKAMAECTRLEKEIEEKDRTIEKQNKIRG